MAQAPEGLGQDTEAEAVDPGESVEVDEDGPGLLAEVVESLAKGGGGGRSELSG